MTIYLDYMATTPVEPRVVEAMRTYLGPQQLYANSASRWYDEAYHAAEAVEKARQQVASLINAQAEEIIWTSGATESNNLAIKGAADFYQKKGRHIVTCTTEHKAVLDTCAYLEKQGYEVTYVRPQSNGLIDLAELKVNLRAETLLVSIMHANNEIGVVQDLQAIGQLVKENGSLFHVDAAQSAGKVAIDVEKFQCDLMSFSAHKVYGPKGIGALYVRRYPKVRLTPLIHGGGQEHSLRAGTLATHQIVGMGMAFEIAEQTLATEGPRLLKLREKLWQGLKELPGLHVNGDLTQRLPGNLNISVEFVDGQALLLLLSDKLALSSGSACNSAAVEPSYVLTAIGRESQLAYTALRFSLGRFTIEDDVDETITIVKQAITQLRDLSPLWELHQQGKGNAGKITFL